MTQRDGDKELPPPQTSHRQSKFRVLVLRNPLFPSDTSPTKENHHQLGTKCAHLNKYQSLKTTGMVLQDSLSFFSPLPQIIKEQNKKPGHFL